MTPDRPGRTCDWPGCPEEAVDELAMRPGMSLTIEGVPFAGDAFGVCAEHAPRIGQVGQRSLEQATRRGAARKNLAPGDAEWNEYFGEDG